MGETCVHACTYIADYTCLCCDNVKPNIWRANNIKKILQKHLNNEW